MERNKKDAYAWPGGYPLCYVAEYLVICPDCVNDPESDFYDADSTPQINWEDSALFCDCCSERIESAYAEDDAE